MAVEHHLGIIKDQLDNDLIPQLLALNGWFLKQEDMPKAVFGDIADHDLDMLSKFVQRVVSVGALTVDKELDNFLRKASGVKEQDYAKDREIPEEFSSQARSRAGDGLATAGEGTSNNTTDDASVGNMEAGGS